MARGRRTAAQASPPAELPEEDEPMSDGNEEASEDEDDESSSDGEPVVPFLATREKRVNAGNRMRQLLEEEFAEEEDFKDEVDDVEFEAKDEADIFDSDFGSTDSGGSGEEDEDAGERQLEREANQAKRDARGKKSKKTHTPFIPSFARHTKQDKVASTSATTLDGPQDGEPIRKRRKRVYDGFPAQRESSRKAAVAFKESVQEKLQESEKRKATSRQPNRKAVAELTQADLIMEALETEDVNRASLLAFYAAEEDRRAQERIASMRYQITGPRITWISRLEGVERKVHASKADGKGKGKEVEQDKAGGMESGRRRLIEVIGEAGKEGWTAPEKDKAGVADGQANPGGQEDRFEGQGPGAEAIFGGPVGKSQLEVAMEVDEAEVAELATENATPLTSGGPPKPPTSHEPTPRSTTSTVAPTHPTPTSNNLPSLPTTSLIAPTSTSSVPAAYLPGAPIQCSIPAPPVKHLNSGAHARAYLILEDFEGTITEEMAAYFGEHWGSLKPSRRVARSKPARCAFTGRVARYRDPLTRTPYADLSAYDTLRKVVAGGFAWAGGAGAWTGEKGVGVQAEVEMVQGGREEVGLGQKIDELGLEGGGLGTPPIELFAEGALPPLPPLPPLPGLAAFGNAPSPAKTMF